MPTGQPLRRSCGKFSGETAFRWAKCAPSRPGTNAVFRVGDLVVKIYAPAETGVGQELGRESEVQAMRAAAAVGVHTAGVVAAGELADRYAFSYLVTRFVSGAALGDVVREGSAAERRAIGR